MLGTVRFHARRALGVLLSCLPLGLLGFAARVSWGLAAALSANVRAEGVARLEAGRFTLGLVQPQARHGRFLEWLVDLRMYCVRRNGRNWPGMSALTDQLVARVRDIRETSPDCPVILSPFHYVSQYLNIQICDAVREKLGMDSLAVVSAVPSDTLGDDGAMVPGLRVLHTAQDSSRKTMGLAVVRALKQERMAVVFADLPPFALFGFPRETTGVCMFGRPARVHNGVFRLGAPTQAVLLPFFLRYEGDRIGGVVLDPIRLSDSDAPQQLAECIETSLRANYAQWIYAGHPSFYAFAPER